MNRRALLGTVGTVGVVSVTGCAARDSFNSQKESENWPMVYHDTYNSNSVRATPPRDRPRVAWEATVFDPDNLVSFPRLSEPTPVIADGRLYIGGSRLTAHDTTSGERVWEVSTEGLVTGLATTENRIYVVGVAGTERQSGTLAVHDPMTGERRWKRGCGATPAPPILSVAGVVVATHDGHSAFNESGDRRWQTDSDTESVFPAAPPALTEDRIYLPAPPAISQYRQGGLSTRLGSPKQVWTGSSLSPGQRFYPPAVVGQSILVPVANRVPPERVLGDRSPGLTAYGVNGSVRWRFPVSTGISTPAVADGTAYVVATATEWSDQEPRTPVAGDARLVAIDVASGDVQWTITYSGFGFGAFAPIVSDGRIYAVLRDEPNQTGVLAATTTDGERLWTVSLRERPLHLAAVGDQLFVTLLDGSVHAFGPS